MNYFLKIHAQNFTPQALIPNLELFKRCIGVRFLKTTWQTLKMNKHINVTNSEIRVLQKKKGVGKNT
jgi:hypothetical protein